MAAGSAAGWRLLLCLETWLAHDARHAISESWRKRENEMAASKSEEEIIFSDGEKARENILGQCNAV